MNALIQLGRSGYDIHLRDDVLSSLKQSCNLLNSEPIADLHAVIPAEELARTELLITGWGSKPVDMKLREAMPRLKLIAHLAGSVKSIVSPEVMQSGVRVTHAAAANAKPVAQYVLAVILLHNKRVPDWVRLYSEKRSQLRVRSEPLHSLIGNRDKTIGIVGASRVGRYLIEFLQPHNFRILLHDPFVPAQEAKALGVEMASLDNLLTESDVVSLHQPLLPTTQKSFGAREFTRMRDGALFINTARGAIVDQGALIDAIRDGRLSAMLDVTDPEPLPDDSPLWDMPNVLLTPHIAGSLGTEVAEMTEMVIEEIRRFTRNEPLQYEVAADAWERVA
nr:hydroxyacid dehydrogenase [Pseudoruegeria sp. HB172150]